MPGNKRTVAAIVRAMSARKQADFAPPARTSGLTSSAATSSINRSYIPGPPTLAAAGLSASGRASRINNTAPF
jgi:hypothetical protein